MASPQVLDYRLLFEWFALHRRDLPWRTEPRDPYRVWLSEVMLQQTQVATVIPYFERWLARFPTLRDFAEAPLDDVLKHWEGLGYYARARNFHKAARIVLQDHNGRIPDTVSGLLTLPGVGRYTAGAVASLAYGRDAAALDGNVKRVLARLYALAAQHAEPESLWVLAESLVPAGRAGLFNEALMELGATVCTPRAPRCEACPLALRCAAKAEGAPERYPINAERPATPHHDVLTAIVRADRGRLLLCQRVPGGLLGGLWEFVSNRFRDPVLSIDATAAAGMVYERCGLSVAGGTACGRVKHAFTHFKITRHLFAFHCAGADQSLATEGYATCGWFTLAEVDALALTRSDRRIVALLAQEP
jgi:A/G-specific adenine glycosylase